MVKRLIGDGKVLVVGIICLFLMACSHHPPRHNAKLSDPKVVRVQLHKQLAQWRGTAYRYGGLTRAGIDCSGFVYRTFSDRFNMVLPRTTRQQSRLGSKVSKDELAPGDLLFFKTGWGEGGLHVGIYDANNQFIHASTSRGVTRSSLNNVYWRKTYWQARRL